MEKGYNDIANKVNMSAREYFYILRLAIYHVDKKQLDTSVEIAQYPKTAQIYKCACRIAKAL